MMNIEFVDSTWCVSPLNSRFDAIKIMGGIQGRQLIVKNEDGDLVSVGRNSVELRETEAALAELKRRTMTKSQSQQSESVLLKSQQKPYRIFSNSLREIEQ